MIAPFVVWVTVIWLPVWPIVALPFTTSPLVGKLCAIAGNIGIAIAPTSAIANRCRRIVRSCFRV
ncbi:MAG: hypothetical protein RR969_08500, partial [Thermomonas sp.]